MKKVPSALIGVVTSLFACIIFLSLISYSAHDLGFLAQPSNLKVQNIIGVVGAYLAFWLNFAFGAASFFIPCYIFLWGLSKLEIIGFCGFAHNVYVKIISFILLFAFICAFIGLFATVDTEIYSRCGLVGFHSSQFLKSYLGFWGSLIFSLIMISVLCWMLAGEFFAGLFKIVYERSSWAVEKISELIDFIKEKWDEFRGVEYEDEEEEDEDDDDDEEEQEDIKPRRKKKKEEASRKPVSTKKPEIKMYKPKPRPVVETKEDIEEEDEIEQPEDAFDPENYKLPSIEFLKIPPVEDEEETKENIEANIKELESTLNDFNIGAKVVSVQKGPVVTMYELQPFSGVKIQSITALSDDIALSMKAAGVRIVAPIPGRGTIGIEIPNQVKHLVFLREVLEERVFSDAKSKLTMALGKDVKGDPIVANLKEMPHLLIAGATGAGKTVCVNSLISSILFKARPDEVQFIMIDPKMVELAPYKGIPHLIHPIISDAKKSCAALNWAVEEMEKRYKKLAKEGTRNIDAYNKKGLSMPYIVIIVDELADLMIVARDKIETAIQRLAQLSRAVGIHLVLATQRPSVDVITGVIKANFPARISFKVASRVDSRTVLDTMGAEKLLGKGDLLFIKPGFTSPLRGQGAFTDDEDIGHITSFIRKQGGPVYEEEIIESHKRTQARIEGDELLDEAIQIVLTTQQASASMIQRRLRVGYNRAARLVDLMEAQGIVGPSCGSKAREILVDPQEYFSDDGEEDE